VSLLQPKKEDFSIIIGSGDTNRLRGQEPEPRPTPRARARGVRGGPSIPPEKLLSIRSERLLMEVILRCFPHEANSKSPSQKSPARLHVRVICRAA
jgi:hypothetical protein